MFMGFGPKHLFSGNIHGRRTVQQSTEQRVILNGRSTREDNCIDQRHKKTEYTEASRKVAVVAAQFVLTALPPPPCIFPAQSLQSRSPSPCPRRTIRRMTEIL